MDWVEDDILAYVKRKLGDGVVSVELSDDHLRDALADALLWINRRLPRVRFLTQQIGPGKGRISLDIARHPLSVDPIPPDSETYNSINYEAFTLSNMVVGTPIDLDYWYITRLYQDTVTRTFGADFEWEFDEENRDLYFSGMPSTCTRILIRYPQDWTLAELEPKQIYHQWFLNAVLMYAKKMLGRIRSKYSSIPGGGGDISMDGPALLEEAKAEEEALKAQLELMTGEVDPEFTWG